MIVYNRGSFLLGDWNKGYADSRLFLFYVKVDWCLWYDGEGSF